MQQVDMKNKKQTKIDILKFTLLISTVLLLGFVVYFLANKSDLQTENEELRISLESERAKLAALQEEIEEGTKKIDSLEGSLEEAEEEKENLEEDLEEAEEKYEEIEDSIGDALGTVEILNKKSQVDPQLLQKYSKVFFLNEHYTPSSLESVEDDHLVIKDVDIHGKIQPFLEDLLEEAEDDDLDIKVISGYRSFGTQANLKNQYVQTYGAGTANQFSADQGYSEHQLGTTVDFSNGTLLQNFTDFDNTEEYEWLQKNAYKYGFILSYPEGNAYYQFEPWHWRFVGKDLAKYLHREDLNFYDVDQRKIDEYTASFWDK